MLSSSTLLGKRVGGVKGLGVAVLGPCVRDEGVLGRERGLTSWGVGKAIWMCYVSSAKPWRVLVDVFDVYGGEGVD